MTGAASGADSAFPGPLSEDGFLGGRLRVLQPEAGYRAGIDAVMLAASVPCAPGDDVFEAGIGTGVAALCLARRVSGVRITGVEIAADYASLAEENARRNGLAGAVTVIGGDVREATRGGLPQCPPPGSFRHVFANPPYFEAGRVRHSPVGDKARAHAMTADDLESWVKVMAAMAAPRGVITLIHRAQALGRILAALERRAGDVRVMGLYPRADRPASRVIVQAVKGSRAEPKLMHGLVLHGAGSGFTPEAEAILRDGEALRMG